MIALGLRWQTYCFVISNILRYTNKHPDEKVCQIRSSRSSSKEASISFKLKCTIFQEDGLINFLYTFIYLTVHELSEPYSLGFVLSSLHGHGYSHLGLKWVPLMLTAWVVKYKEAFTCYSCFWEKERQGIKSD